MFVFTGRSNAVDRELSLAEPDEELIALQRREDALREELERLEAAKREKVARSKQTRGPTARQNKARRKRKQKVQHDPLLLTTGFDLFENSDLEDDDEPSERLSFDAKLSGVARDEQMFSPVFSLPAIQKKSNTKPRSSHSQSSPSNQRAKTLRAVRATQPIARDIEEEHFNNILVQQLGMTRAQLEQLRSPPRQDHNTDDAIRALMALDASKPQHHEERTNPSPRQMRVTSRGRKHLPPPRTTRKKFKGRRTVAKSARTAEDLRRQLNSSIGAVQSLTHSVRNDIDVIRQLAPIGNKKARRFMQRWSAEKLFQIGGRILFRIVSQWFQTWVRAVNILRLEEKRREYDRLLAARNLMNIVRSAIYLPALTNGFRCWILHRDEKRAVEEDAANYVYAQVIQSQARVWLARRHRDLLLYRREHQIEWGNAIMIQTAYRGMKGRIFGRAYMAAEKRRRAATQMQRVARGRAGRQRAAAKLQTKMELQSAHRIQQAYRSHAAIRELRLRRVRADEGGAATKINSLARGVRDRKRATKLAARRKRHRAAASVQSVVRGRQERKKVQMLRAKRAMERRRQDAAARKIQAVYRGHRGRLSTYIIMMEHNEKKLKRNNAAKVIQRFWQNMQETSSALKASAANMLLMVGQAKQYTQYMDDGVGKMFYHNAATDESLWEPPASGYISTTGTYVLADGTEINPKTSTRLAKEAWKKFKDKDSDEIYWYNSATGVTAWSNPLPDVDLPLSDEREHAEHEAARTANDDAVTTEVEPTTQWTEYIDDETGDPYWATENGETTWENPYT